MTAGSRHIGMLELPCRQLVRLPHDAAGHLLSFACHRRLSDLPPLPRAGSGRLPEGFSQMSSGASGVSRPTPLQASAAMPPFSAQSNAAAAALADAMAARGSSTADPPEVATGGRAVTPPAASGAAELQKQEDAPAPLRGLDGQSGIQVAISVCTAHHCSN